ncbi:rod-binding protein [Paracoccus pacificus]|uniref:Rod-binding protein n=1 Tax=Paracoccus pacificus TaxID=1463598 RepID=A0ABW4R692_9RHOB
MGEIERISSGTKRIIIAIQVENSACFPFATMRRLPNIYRRMLIPSHQTYHAVKIKMLVNNSLIAQSKTSAPQKVSDKLEQAFLEQMLSYITPADSGEFGGGVGEDQFKSFLLQQRAADLSRSIDLRLIKNDGDPK